jgi:2-(1,2-epoxy-1,2-dihydrophenyl)acetyl-CoA isomerase
MIGGTEVSYTQIEYVAGSDGVVTLTLNRPSTLNAYTTVMCDEIRDALDGFARTDSARVLIVTGAGRGFCSGGDLSGHAEMLKAASRQLGHAAVMREGMHPVMRQLYRLDKPVIAMINGPAIAGGLALALLCDFRIGADTAILGDTSGLAGALPDEGGAWLFPRVMGYDQAFRMVALSEKYDAATALRLGLLTEVVPRDELAGHTTELARALATRAAVTVRITKRIMRRAQELDFEASLGDAEMAVVMNNDTEDAQEGVAAFLEHRPPRFQGR